MSPPKRKVESSLTDLASKRAKLREELRVIEETYAIQEKIDAEVKKLESYEELVAKSKEIIRELESTLPDQ